jgi:glycosyltransferase involved in cell wall biosynthesis
MKLLFIASDEHLSGAGGGATAVRNFVANLEKSVPGGVLHVMRLPCPAGWLPRRARQVLAFARAIFSRYPSKFYFLAPINWRRRMRTIVAQAAPDLIIVNGADLLPLLSVPGRWDTAFVAHNVEHRLLQEQISRMAVFPKWLKRFLDRDALKMKALETDFVQNVRNVMALSADDAEYFTAQSGCMNVATVGSTFGYSPFRKMPRDVVRPIHVAFLAKMSWWPNLEAARWYVAEVLPKLPPGRVITHFYGPGSEVFCGVHPDLQAHGFVEDISKVWESADFIICPIRSGSGLNIKFMEALYNHMPVLATPITVRGLQLIENAAIIYLEKADDWAVFLAGPNAEALASAVVPDHICNLFASDHQIATFKQFLEKTLGPISDACPG